MLSGAGLLRAGLALATGAACALLVACGSSSSGAGLIPADQAGPLKADFELVAHAAANAEGDCTKTEAALAKTELDFSALPSSVDSGLRNTLSHGIANLRARATQLCAQPLATTSTTPPATRTSTTTTTTPTSTTTTPTTTTTTPTTTAPTTTPTITTTTPAGSGGGTPAPGEAKEGSGGGEVPNVGGVGPESGK